MENRIRISEQRRDRDNGLIYHGGRIYLLSFNRRLIIERYEIAADK